MNKIIALTGLPGSGKTTAAKLLEEQDFKVVRFGDITDEELKKRGLERTEENEKLIRVLIRQEHGMDAYAKLSISKIKKHDLVVIDGVKSYQEYELLKKELGKVVLVCLTSSNQTRYERLTKREERPLTLEESRARDERELYKQNLFETIQKSDVELINEGKLEELKENFNALLNDF